MKIFTFLFIIFVVSFLSDIILRDLSMNFNTITSLRPYFKNMSIIESAIYAGITIEVAIIITMLFSKLLFGFMIPKSNIELLKYCILAFVLGYIIDVYIDKTHLFKDLTLFYKEIGSGFWGSITFLFSIIISYFIQKVLLPIL